MKFWSSWPDSKMQIRKARPIRQVGTRSKKEREHLIVATSLKYIPF